MLLISNQSTSGLSSQKYIFIINYGRRALDCFLPGPIVSAANSSKNTRQRNTTSSYGNTLSQEQTRGVIRPDDVLGLEPLLAFFCGRYVGRAFCRVIFDLRRFPVGGTGKLEGDFSMPIPNWVVLLFIAHGFKFRDAEPCAARKIFRRSLPLDFAKYTSLGSRSFVVFGAGGSRATVAAPSTKRLQTCLAR